MILVKVDRRHNFLCLRMFLVSGWEGDVALCSVPAMMWIVRLGYGAGCIWMCFNCLLDELFQDMYHNGIDGVAGVSELPWRCVMDVCDVVVATCG